MGAKSEGRCQRLCFILLCTLPGKICSWKASCLAAISKLTFATLEHYYVLLFTTKFWKVPFQLLNFKIYLSTSLYLASNGEIREVESNITTIFKMPCHLYRVIQPHTAPIALPLSPLPRNTYLLLVYFLLASSPTWLWEVDRRLPQLMITGFG